MSEKKDMSKNSDSGCSALEKGLNKRCDKNFDSCLVRGRGLGKERGRPVAVDHSLTFCCVKTLSNAHTHTHTHTACTKIWNAGMPERRNTKTRNTKLLKPGMPEK